MSKLYKFLLVFSFILFFLTIPFIYYFFLFNLSDNKNVKGVSTFEPKYSGVIVNIKSTQGNWDMYKFLCSTISDCTSSLNNGKPWGIVSGGTIDNYFYNLNSLNNEKEEKEDYKFIKIYVRSSWGSVQRIFEPSIKFDNNKDFNLYEIKNDLNNYKVVIFPIEYLKSLDSYKIEFSDK